ncbi:MAG: MopE-related protein [Myxococcota bacterium]|jgi:cysteine-rich repeat protein|nr:MopE-related protein [Myxococcota bacterium]
MMTRTLPWLAGLFCAAGLLGCSLLVEGEADDSATSGTDTHSETTSETGLETVTTDPVTDPGTDPSTGDTGDTEVSSDTVLGQCLSTEDCDDLNPCNGYEKCDFETYLCIVEPGADDGTGCALPWSPNAPAECLNGECVEVACPNGTRTVHEECDDGNTIEGDGCDNDCRYSCQSDIECDDGNPCDGSETCDTVVTLACQERDQSDWLPVGEDCGDFRFCNNAGECVPRTCGDCEANGEEDCDDCNGANGDGCDNDCTWTCGNNEDCADGDVCNGDEFCSALHQCHQSTQELLCPEPDPCHLAAGCDPLLGCLEDIVDNDSDGYAPASEGCGLDCDDLNKLIHPGVADLCDGIDNDCDTRTDEDGPYWYRDCDGDGFAPALAESVRSCDPPFEGPTSCPFGTWTSLRPVGDNVDCCDFQSDAYPRQERFFHEAFADCKPTTWDYNCNKEVDYAIPDLWSLNFPCKRVRDDCEGHMWAKNVTVVPPCGTSASALLCTMHFTGTCVRSATTETVTQRCH